MYFSSVFVSSIGLLASLASCATPDKLYRGTNVKPADGKSAGGFTAIGFQNGRTNAVPANQANLFKHVTKQWGTISPLRDPFISTSSDIDVSKSGAADSSKYVYYLDSSKISNKIWDVQAEYDSVKKPYPHAEEKEFSVEKQIPWDAVTGYEGKGADGKYTFTEVGALQTSAPVPASSSVQAPQTTVVVSTSKPVSSVKPATQSATPTKRAVSFSG